MYRKFILLFLMSIFISSSAAFAQSGYQHSDRFRDWNVDKFFKWHIHGDPFLEFSYGMSELKHKELTSKFSDFGLAEIKLGFSRTDDFYDSTIVEIDDRFAFVSDLSTKLLSEDAKAWETTGEILRFGFSRRSGYGYDFGGIQLLPYNEYGASWSRLKTDKRYFLISSSMSPQDILKDNLILDRYENEFRFGTIAEAGVRLQFASAVSINAAYEASVIFPRYLIWKHMGSLAIEGAAFSSLEYFIDEVLDSSPAAGPIVNFLLKNGLSYAFYALKRDRMNWPFKTETPLTYETFKFGVSFVF